MLQIQAGTEKTEHLFDGDKLGDLSQRQEKVHCIRANCRPLKYSGKGSSSC